MIEVILRVYPIAGVRENTGNTGSKVAIVGAAAKEECAREVRILSSPPKPFFDILELDKTGDGGGVFQPPQTGATMVATMVRVLLPVSEESSLPDVEERTKETRMVASSIRHDV